jgi:hypothetical protein
MSIEPSWSSHHHLIMKDFPTRKLPKEQTLDMTHLNPACLLIADLIPLVTK